MTTEDTFTVDLTLEPEMTPFFTNDWEESTNPYPTSILATESTTKLTHGLNSSGNFTAKQGTTVKKAVKLLK